MSLSCTKKVVDNANLATRINVSMIQSMETPRGIILIREASLADAVQFRELRLSALEDSPTAFSADLQTNLVHPMSFWESRLRPDPYGTIFFAEHDSKLIGMTGVRQGESAKTKHAVLVWGVYVRPEWRGLRIAGKLLETACNWAGSHGAELAKLAVVAANTTAVKCYERCGFTVYGTEPKAIRYDGVDYDEYLMLRPLGNS